jgi:NAD(P)-dependent dehydrogenase (short-subunit alcohol dehydrogenase family)
MIDVHGRTVLVTGATSGLGRHVATELAAQGARVVVHGRDSAKVDGLVAELAPESAGARAIGFVADLADLDAVDRLADDVLERVDQLDVLVNNAGVGFGPPGLRREESAQGLELRFAVNYLAGALLTRRLLPLLQRSAPARIVNVASIGQAEIDFDDPQFEHDFRGRVAYQRSKLAQVMFTIDLAGELDPASITVNSLHPATFMNTNMVIEGGGTPMSTVEEGAEATLRLIGDPELDGVTGRFFDGTVDARAQAQAYDPTARARLRTLTDELLAAPRH